MAGRGRLIGVLTRPNRISDELVEPGEEDEGGDDARPVVQPARQIAKRLLPPVGNLLSLSAPQPSGLNEAACQPDGKPKHPNQPDRYHPRQ